MSISRCVSRCMRSLRWPIGLQTAPNGFFRAVGTESFVQKRQPSRAFDQQAVLHAALDLVMAWVEANGLT